MVCGRCGAFTKHETINRDERICSACGHRQRFQRLPLFYITGASGSGKSAILPQLRAQLPECVVLEHDVLLRPEIDWSQQNWDVFRSTWLRLALHIGQSDRSVVLCGTTWPDNEDRLPEREYFSAIHYLCLVCDDAVLVERLRSRPAWRGSGDAGFIERMRSFNRYAVEHPHSRVALLDMTSLSIEEAARRAADWVRRAAVVSE